MHANDELPFQTKFEISELRKKKDLIGPIAHAGPNLLRGVEEMERAIVRERARRRHERQQRLSFTMYQIWAAMGEPMGWRS